MILCTFLCPGKPRVLLCQPKGASLSERNLLAVLLRVIHLRGKNLQSLCLHLGLYLMRMDPLALSGMGKTTAVLMTHFSQSCMIFGSRIPKFGPGDSEALAMSF